MWDSTKRLQQIIWLKHAHRPQQQSASIIRTQNAHDNYTAHIFYAKYKQVGTNKVAANQKHINPNQHQELQYVLANEDKLFDGSLGVYPHQNIHIELSPNLEPVHQHLCPVLEVHKQMFNKELQHIGNIGILEECRASK